MKKKLTEKLNEKAAELLVRDLDQKALEAVTGGGGGVTVPRGVCRACGIMATIGI
jgi:hypothetical protein